MVGAADFTGGAHHAPFNFNATRVNAAVRNLNEYRQLDSSIAHDHLRSLLKQHDAEVRDAGERGFRRLSIRNENVGGWQVEFHQGDE